MYVTKIGCIICCTRLLDPDSENAAEIFVFGTPVEHFNQEYF